MSKLIQALIHQAHPQRQAPLSITLGQEAHQQRLFNEQDPALEAQRIYQAATDQVRYQLKGFNYQTAHQDIVAGVAARVTSELNPFDLQQTGIYAAIQHAIVQWKSQSGEQAKACQIVKQALLSCLPAARQTQQLKLLCREYKEHLALDIHSQLYNDHYDLYCRYQAASSSADNSIPSNTLKLSAPSANPDLDHFIKTSLKSGTLPDSDLKKTVVKYEAVTALENTLYNAHPATQQVQDFQQAFTQQKPKLEQHRDSFGLRFLKGVVTVLTLGAAACFGIFNVKGAGVAQTMKEVLTTPALSGSRSD